MHPLDNVIWQALNTRHAHFAEGSGAARRFVPEVSPLSAFENPNEDGYASLAVLAKEGQTIGIFIDQPYEPRDEWEWVAGAPLLQMVHENGNGASPKKSTQAAILKLGLPDSAEMIALTELTKPGPFGPRTHELGTYLGIRDNGMLVAMAGERLKVPGFTEVSAVCTHPDHLGKGYAGLLMLEVMRGIRERGETPFLHLREDNTRALELYKRLGFRIRKSGHFAVLRRR
jgi:ribosomal protein S18 acetylase RimI-like enzyme